MVLDAVVAGEPLAGRALSGHGAQGPEGASLVGQTGLAATDLFPSGQVIIDTRRYEARLAVGFAEAGTPVKVIALAEFGLIVEDLS
jgi:membrane-bound serine protease (ClpP class)